jgi:hypothetical protein
LVFRLNYKSIIPTNADPLKDPGEVKKPFEDTQEEK